MPYSANSELPDAVKNSLPEAAQTLFRKTFNASYEGTCAKREDRDACASKIAWSQVSKQYEKGEDGWHPKSLLFPEFSMAIVKASFDKATSEMRWRAVASDTDEDLYGERMTLELFSDFVKRIEEEAAIPSPFDEAVCETGWCGGMPYMSISHYKSAGGKNVPGELRSVYLDGNRLKAQGVIYDNPLGMAVFKAINKDLYGQSEYEDKIRISIGFLDLKHAHGDFVFERKGLKDTCPMCSQEANGKSYLGGQLVHLALTRVPVNPRTEMEVERMATKLITKKKDAESIIGEQVENLVETKAQVADELIIVKSEDDTVLPEVVSANAEKAVVTETPLVEEAKTKHTEEDPNCACETCQQKRDEEEAKKKKSSALDVAWETLKAKIAELKASGTESKSALETIQGDFNTLGEQVIKEFSLTEEKSETSSDLSAVIKALADLRNDILPLKEEIGLLKAQVASAMTIKSTPNTVPQPRSITIPRNVLEQKAGFDQSKPMSLVEIARRSVGLSN
jgi:cation transport regulator